MDDDESVGISDIGTRMANELRMTELNLRDVDDLPPALIVTNVPAIVFTNANEKANFAALFTELDANIKFEYFRSFRRVRMTFGSPQTATAARVYCDHLSFNGYTLKTYFAQKPIEHTRIDDADVVINADVDRHHLRPPPLEKQFLISPPSSPPVGWEQQKEMAPIVCSFDLMSRLAAFAVDDTVYEVHPGSDRQPAILIHPATGAGGIATPSGGKLPHTPRPPTKIPHNVS